MVGSSRNSANDGIDTCSVDGWMAVSFSERSEHRFADSFDR